jgi:hypothetical protein
LTAQFSLVEARKTEEHQVERAWSSNLVMDKTVARPCHSARRERDPMRLASGAQVAPKAVVGSVLGLTVPTARAVAAIRSVQLQLTENRLPPAAHRRSRSPAERPNLLKYAP